MKEKLIMSKKDIDRLQVLEKVIQKELTQTDAARLLGISDRQVRKLIKRRIQEGPEGITSRLIGRPGNRNKPPEIKRKVLALLREKYEGFGPTLAAEKLYELEGIKVSKETIRGWMLESHLWQCNQRKFNLHATRLRRACFGELIQADGSPDHWFGPDFPEANATVLIDDATSTITALYFSETETLEAYFLALEEHLNKHGRPLALYTDYSAIFYNSKGVKKTQMQQALGELGINSILASSPQAKGRVERANRTLQDRLKKEFQLRRITTIEQANVYAKEFLKQYNEKFSKKPMNACDAHRSLEGYDLERILSRKEERSLNALGIFQFNNDHYQIQGQFECRQINKRKVEVRFTKNGVMKTYFEGKEVKVVSLKDLHQQEMTRKEVLKWMFTERRKPGPYHPWRHYQATKNIKEAI